MPPNPLKLGIGKPRRKTQPVERADELADVTLDSVDGGEVRLGTLWEEGPAVLVFLRHYG